MRDENTGMLDVVDELRLRRWARENYVSVEDRRDNWHPVVLEEMQRKDAEMHEYDDYRRITGALVPLHPGSYHYVHGPHAETTKAQRLLRVPVVVQ